MISPNYKMMLVAIIIVAMIFIAHWIPVNSMIEQMIPTKPIIGWVLLAVYYFVAVIIGLFVSTYINF